MLLPKGRGGGFNRLAHSAGPNNGSIKKNNTYDWNVKSTQRSGDCCSVRPNPSNPTIYNIMHINIEPFGFQRQLVPLTWFVKSMPWYRPKVWHGFGTIRMHPYSYICMDIAISISIWLSMCISSGLISKSHWFWLTPLPSQKDGMLVKFVWGLTYTFGRFGWLDPFVLHLA